MRTLYRLFSTASIALLLLVVGGGIAGTAQSAPKPGKFGPLTQDQPTSTADATGNGANPGLACESRDPVTNNPTVEGFLYCSQRSRSAPVSQNGLGDGQAVGKPCPGCVGRADNKNPPGQGNTADGEGYPATATEGDKAYDPDFIGPRLIQPDKNQGYECDGNNGIGRTNPAHTQCDP